VAQAKRDVMLRDSTALDALTTSRGRHLPMRIGQLPVLQSGAGHIRDRQALHEYAKLHYINWIMQDLTSCLFQNRPDKPLALLQMMLGERPAGENRNGVDPATGVQPEHRLKEKEEGLLRVQDESFGDGGVRRRNLSLLVVPSPEARLGHRLRPPARSPASDAGRWGRCGGVSQATRDRSSAPTAQWKPADNASGRNDQAAAMNDSAHNTALAVLISLSCAGALQPTLRHSLPSRARRKRRSELARIS
jgi:hypothetical protein